MSIDTLAVRPVTILVAAESEDRYGDIITDWSAATATPVQAWLGPITTTENFDQRDATISTRRATFPCGTRIGPLDRVLVGDVTYEVDGQPNEAWTPRGPHHVACTLRAVVG